MEKVHKQRRELAKDLRLVVVGRPNDAFLAMDRFCTAHPDMTFAVEDNLVDFALISGRFKDALKILNQGRRELQGNQWARLQRGLASSALGDARDVPVGFIQEMISDSLFNEGKGHISDPYRLPDRSARYLAAASSLALGLRTDLWIGIPYLEMSLRYDPANDIAAETLVNSYDGLKRYSDERRVAKQMIRNLQPGVRRDYFSKRLSVVQGRPDVAGNSLRIFDRRQQSLKDRE